MYIKPMHAHFYRLYQNSFCYLDPVPIDYSDMLWGDSTNPINHLVILNLSWEMMEICRLYTTNSKRFCVQSVWHTMQVSNFFKFFFNT